MRSSVLLKSCLTLAIVHSMIVDESRAILTKTSDNGRVQYQPAARKVSINPHIYKYLRGYYQNDKTAQASVARRQAVHVRKPVLADNAKEQSAGKKYGSANLQPRSGLQSGRYRFAQSPNYVQKLKRLAAILRARAAARAQRKAPTQGYPAGRQQALTGYQQQQRQKPQPPQPNVQRSAAPQYSPQPSYIASPPRQFAPPLSPQLAPSPPQRSYGVPRAPPPQQSYPRPSQNPSFQSLGLPRGQTYQLPAPVTTPRPSQKINTDTLVKLLKASYASLMPLLLNQVRMTSYGVQRIPLYGSNPYSVFGPMTYGPLPKPNLSQMTLTYNPSTFSSAKTRPVSGYGNSGVPQQQSGYGSSLYGSRSPQTGYSSSQSYDISPDATCGLVSDLFCHGRTAGLYSHPASGHCFVQCDHVGRGVARSCSPGTMWKALGPEPALFNYCS